MSADATLHFDPNATPRGGVGTMLRDRRLELSMSQADVAKFVKLPVRRIEAMEAERWDELPDGPFLRGFLKNIARALDLDAATLMARVDDSLIQSRNPDSILVPQAVARGTLPRRSGPAAEHRSGRPLVLGAFACAIVAALIAWSGTESFDRAVGSGRRLIAATSAPASTPIAATTSGEANRSDGDAARPTDASIERPSPAPLPVGGDPSAASTVDAATRADAQNALRLRFNEESWVEVRAADGKLLLKRLNPPGTEQTIEGEGPFTLIVGNAKGVALQYRGLPVDLSPYTRDQVARLTLS